VLEFSTSLLTIRSNLLASVFPVSQTDRLKSFEASSNCFEISVFAKYQGDILRFRVPRRTPDADFRLANFIFRALHLWQDNRSLLRGNRPSFLEPKVLGLSQSQKTQVDVVPWFVILRGPETALAKGLSGAENSLIPPNVTLRRV